jgi:hypothetical protein
MPEETLRAMTTKPGFSSAASIMAPSPVTGIVTWNPGANFLGAAFLGVLALHLGGAGALGQNIPSLMQTNAMRAHEKLYSQFKSGETNVPLLRLDVFQGMPETGFASKDGRLFSYAEGSMSNVGWSRTLAPADLARLIEVINALPPSSKETIPLDSQIHISGLRSNQWCHFVYDINACPGEIAEICRTFGAPFNGNPAFSGAISNRAKVKPGS